MRHPVDPGYYWFTGDVVIEHPSFLYFDRPIVGRTERFRLDEPVQIIRDGAGELKVWQFSGGSAWEESIGHYDGEFAQVRRAGE